MTRRRSSYRSLASLQRDLSACRACVEAGYPLESLPVRNVFTGQRAYMYGQAPGIVEGEERRPWRGRAGGTLHLEGKWQASGPVGQFTVSGTLGGRQVAVLIPEA